MKDLLDFMGEHPWFSFFVIWLLIMVTAKTVIISVRFVMRHLNIRKAGWPPPHVDADGDHVEPEEPKDGTGSQD